MMTRQAAKTFAADNPAKPSRQWVPVRLDVQTWLTLFTIKADGERTPNDVIRRLVNLPARKRKGSV